MDRTEHDATVFNEVESREFIQWEGPGWYAIRSHRDSGGEFYIHSPVFTKAKRNDPFLADEDNRGTGRGNPWWYEEEPTFSVTV